MFFYELAVRHATRKPFVQMIEKGGRIPFDLAGVRTIEIDHTDLNSVADAKAELKGIVRLSVESSGSRITQFTMPFSVSQDWTTRDESIQLCQKNGNLLVSFDAAKLFLRDEQA